MEKTRSQIGSTVDERILKINTDKVRNSWDRIYHEQVDDEFRFVEATKPQYRHKTKPSETLRCRFKMTNFVRKLRNLKHNLEKRSSRKTSPTSVAVRRKQKSSPDLSSVQFFKNVGVEVALNSKLAAVKDSEDISAVERLRMTLLNARVKSIRLPDKQIKSLKLNPNSVSTARSFYFNPHSLSFTPMVIDESKRESTAMIRK